MSKRPATVDLAAYLCWVLVGAGLVVSVLVVLFRARLAEFWSPGQSGDSTIQPVDFVPVIVVLYVVVAATTVTLIPLLRHGHNWARHSLAGIVLGIFVATLGTMRTFPPPAVRWSAIAAGVVSAVALVFLWHPESRRYARPTDDAEDAGADEGDAADDGAQADDGDQAADATPGDRAADTAADRASRES